MKPPPAAPSLLARGPIGGGDTPLSAGRFWSRSGGGGGGGESDSATSPKQSRSRLLGLQQFAAEEDIARSCRVGVIEFGAAAAARTNGWIN